MVLCDQELIAALDNGHLVIEPRPTQKDIKTTSIDLHLHDQFKRWKAPTKGMTPPAMDPSNADFDYNHVAEQHSEDVPKQQDGSVLLEPHQFILGITRERIQLPPNAKLAARVEGRSTLARLGLGIHVTAPTIHADFRGRITLEMFNLGCYPICLRPGLAVCQLIVECVFGTPKRQMKSVFQDQESVLGSPRT